MSATTPNVGQARADGLYEDRRTLHRETETKPSFKTTEFFIYVAVVIGILIAGAVTKAGSNGNDVLRASHVWLYVAIVSVGYMVSRGLAKAGVRAPYGDDR
jgi:hypothetical protein